MGDCETFCQSIDLGVRREPRYRIGKSAVENQNDSILDRLLLIEASWMDRGVNDIPGEGVENRTLASDIENSAVFIQRTNFPPQILVPESFGKPSLQESVDNSLIIQALRRS